MQIMLLLALVVVTGFYAWSTQTMAEETIQQRLDSVRPILAIETRDFSLRIVENHTIQLTPVRIVNVGVGPALNVRCTLTYPEHQFNFREWSVVAVGEFKESDFATGFARGAERLARCEANIHLEYTDVFGRPRWSRVAFLANEQKQAVTERGPLQLG